MSLQTAQPPIQKPNDIERIVPGKSPPTYLQEHAARYLLAAGYCNGKIVLDVACGVGYGAHYLTKFATSVIGVDIDQAVIDYAKAVYAGPSFVWGDAQQLPEEYTEKFDVIVSFETLEHLRRQYEFLHEVRRCLTPGGLFICSTPNKNLYLVQGFQPFHTKEFYQNEFISFLSKHLIPLEVYGQSFHPEWHVIPMTAYALTKRILRLIRIRQTGLAPLIQDWSCPSPFDGDVLVEDKVLRQFMPAPLRRGEIPSFLVVVCKKGAEAP